MAEWRIHQTYNGKRVACLLLQYTEDGLTGVSLGLGVWPQSSSLGSCENSGILREIRKLGEAVILWGG